MRQYTRWAAWVSLLTLLAGCGDGPWNNPYPARDEGGNILYSSFSERPKHLDPARSYSSNEYEFIGQIYEPPLQYHYLKRPYELLPLTLDRMPKVIFLDAQGNPLPANAPDEQVAFSQYLLELKTGVQYQPHPAFAKDENGQFRYHALTKQQLESVHTLSDFKYTDSRELHASDYVYQIKRLANPANHSPIFGLMADYIVGLKEYGDKINADYEAMKARGEQGYLDLNAYEIEGVQALDRFRYTITVKGKYPQLEYWLAMPFFAPMPVEADLFYSQPGMEEKNISLDWYPVGTGAYMLTVNNPNRQMILERNPNYRGELYPREGMPEDEAAGLLADAGKKMPFIDKIVFSLETETIPYWNKFLQGYYDTSGISSESFDQAVQINTGGEVALTEEMQTKGIQLATAVASSTYYFGFNMKDDVVGGNSKSAQRLRQAISIAMDYEEFISIFANGRGIAAQGPVPPGIFGYKDGEAGINPVVYDWVDGKAQRKSIEHAKQLLAEAGYPDGVDAKTGAPLTLNLDIVASGPDDKARLSWYRKQFQKLNIQLVIRNTMYNRFQEKMSKGTAQIFTWGWNADYPDPENFMFLLYGPNSKADHQGENAANYSNPKFDKLFEKMKNMENGPERQAIIDEMTKIVREDSPWIWGLHPKSYALYHQWYKNSKPNLMSHNTMQYKRIDASVRAQQRLAWNPPVLWPIALVAGLLLVVIIPAVVIYRRREHMAPRKARV
ncbi:MAG: ABC transporter substrate-binding protein [Gammaproteobacteria bacterium]|nr:ABC transporter substrate-binding protein [Gammaproteobacteria bacterium]